MTIESISKKNILALFIFFAIILPKASISREKCPAGFIVGFSNFLISPNDWGVWVSQKMTDLDRKTFYLVGDKLEIDKPAGKGAYALLLSAHANGQKVTLSSEKSCTQGNIKGSDVVGIVFDQVEVYDNF